MSKGDYPSKWQSKDDELKSHGFDKLVYSILFDTNALREKVRHDLSSSWATQAVEQWCDIIEAMDAYEYFKIIIPEIVLQELHQQQIEMHKAKVEEIRRLTLPSWSFEYEIDYSSFLEGVVNKVRLGKKFGMVPYEIVPLPDAQCFGAIIRRAIEKQAPFEGGAKQSDKGFKDAVIWESLLSYKRAHRDEHIILVTKDNRMNERILLKEFNSEFSDELLVCTSAAELTETLSELIAPLGSGYNPPENIREQALIEEALKEWVFLNTDLIFEYDSTAMQEDERVKLSFLSIEPETDDRAYCAVSKLFSSRDGEMEVYSHSLVFRVEILDSGEIDIVSVSVDGGRELIAAI